MENPRARRVGRVKPSKKADDDSDDLSIDLDEEDVSSSPSEYEPDETDSDSSWSSEGQSSSSLTQASSNEPEPSVLTRINRKSIITVKCSTKSADGQRVWNKKHFCLYCKMPNSKIARHLERKHSTEVEVAKALSFRKKSKRRAALLEEIRNKGNYEHNVEVLQEGVGQLITWRQPDKKCEEKNYLPCPHCWGFFVKTNLWKHEASCRVRKEKNIKRSRRIQSCASRLVPVSSMASRGCKEVLHSMQQDDITLCVKNDPLICMFGNVLLEKHGQNKFQHTYISQKMRELGRFLIAARKIDPTLCGLQDILVPEKFHTVVRATRRASGFMAQRNEYKVPSLACKIGNSLKNVAQIQVAEYLMRGQGRQEKDVKSFIELMATQWNTYVSGRALYTLKTAKWNKDEMIPLTEDIMKLQKHLKVLEKDALKELSDMPSASAWKKLGRNLLTQIILFNRRREGEASRLLLTTFKTRNKAPAHPEILKSLSELEKSLFNNFTRLEIRGKRDRKVPLLLTRAMEASINILINNRNAVGVSKKNPFVFARISGNSNIRGSDSLRHFASECDAEHPERLTSTRLRKHIATLCQMMNLKNSELDQVAKFMGHDIRVHREYYRLSENTIQLAKMSKLLLAVEQGSHTYMGRSLEEVELDDLDSLSKETSDNKEPMRKRTRRVTSPPFQLLRPFQDEREENESDPGGEDQSDTESSSDEQHGRTSQISFTMDGGDADVDVGCRDSDRTEKSVNRRKTGKNKRSPEESEEDGPSRNAVVSRGTSVNLRMPKSKKVLSSTSSSGSDSEADTKAKRKKLMAEKPAKKQKSGESSKTSSSAKSGGSSNKGDNMFQVRRVYHELREGEEDLASFGNNK